MGKNSLSPIAIDGRCRVVVSSVSPEIEGGRFAIKRTVGETVVVEADIFADGHDQLAAVLLYRAETEAGWSEAPMAPMGNDRWRGWFSATQLGGYRYTVLAWIDHFKTWQHDLGKKHKAKQDVTVDLLAGAQMVEAAARRAVEGGATQLAAWTDELAGRGPASLETRLELALSPRLAELMGRYADRRLATTYERELRVVVDPELARFGAWYELFPRSLGQGRAARHLQGCRGAVCRRIADMGFDVLYFPPDPSHRALVPQRQEQQCSVPALRARQPLGHRRGRGRAQGDPSGSWARWRIFAGLVAKARGDAGSRSPSTSRSNARPTIPT